jgi:predicted 2-oxoglutarate/Fe(II)-dependent dioxygenase YbiX
MQDKVTSNYSEIEYIKVYPVFTKDQCKQFIDIYDKDLFQARSATPSGDIVMKNHRDCSLKIVKENKLMDDMLEECLNMYRTSFKFVPMMKRVDSQFLRYDVNGKFNTHIDHYNLSPRTVSMSIMLNDEYMGGNFQFWDMSGKTIIKEIQAVTGDVLLFPSNFLYPHSVAPITMGTRYAIVNWYN